MNLNKLPVINSPFWALSLLGITLFVITVLMLNVPEQISRGRQGQLAIQMLDKMRRPILAIKNVGYQNLKKQTESASFNQSVNLAKTLIKQYLDASIYNPELHTTVKQLSAVMSEWLPLEKKLSQGEFSSNESISKNKSIEIQILERQSFTLFFQALDVLAMGEGPVHKDIDDGRSASDVLLWSTITLVMYLLILIILIQHIRNKELQTHKDNLESLVDQRTADLEAVNDELEAFSYSVSHDLRAPLRAIDGFSLVLLEDYTEELDETGQNHLQRIRSASQKMAQLIDDMLQLSHVSRNPLNTQQIDMSSMAKEIFHDLQQANPDRKLTFTIADNLEVNGDKQLINIALTNLISNAWKYTANKNDVIIEFGRHNDKTFFIKDNGVGFDMKYAKKLFGAFQRLHGSEFEGTGIGLATVKRILNRHQGKIWAEAKPDNGACFYFSI
jgi:signal transduction histidine kinase